MRGSRFAILFIVLCVCLVSCSASSPEDFRDEGQRRAILLTHTLRAIKSREQLFAAQETLKIQFDDLVDLMIQAREWRAKHPDADPLTPLVDDPVSIDLQAQLQRVCHLAGGLEVLEKCQEEGLNRLDYFEKVLNARELSRQKTLLN